MSESLIRVSQADDAARFLATDETVWFAEVLSASVEEQLVGLSEENRFAAEVRGADTDTGTYPGVYGVYPMTLAVPGPEDSVLAVPCAGLTWVGVHPDHRRKGVLTAMMRHHLEHARANGVHVSALHASEPAIYGRYGYGLASLVDEVTLSRGATLTAPHLEGAAAEVTTQMVSASNGDVPERMWRCHGARAELGAVVGAPGYYQRVCFQPSEQLRDKEPWRVLFAQVDGVDVGFAMFRRKEKWEHGHPAGELTVWAMVAEPAAKLAMVRRLVDFDLMGSVTIRTVGVDDPLLRWVGGPRGATRLATYDNLWVRLVDVPAALEGRGWSSPCDVVVEVADEYAPWNAGVWRIHADGSGEATVHRTEVAADLALPVSVLGGAYLGAGNLVALHRAGLVEERRPGAVRELWRAMRTELAPTAAVMF